MSHLECSILYDLSIHNYWLSYLLILRRRSGRPKRKLLLTLFIYYSLVAVEVVSKSVSRSIISDLYTNFCIAVLLRRDLLAYTLYALYSPYSLYLLCTEYSQPASHLVITVCLSPVTSHEEAGQENYWKSSSVIVQTDMQGNNNTPTDIQYIHTSLSIYSVLRRMQQRKRWMWLVHPTIHPSIHLSIEQRQRQRQHPHPHRDRWQLQYNIDERMIQS